MTDVSEAGDPLDLASLRMGRTDLGQREITAKTMTLTRPARNLLLIIDTKRAAGEWLALVRGATLDDLRQLAVAGLVGRAVTAASGTAARANPTSAEAAAGLPVATARMSLNEALLGQSYKVLYDRLTAEARPQLGLIKGYKLILDIERCNGPDEIRLLAERFVEQVRTLHGDAKARALAQRLADPP